MYTSCRYTTQWWYTADAKELQRQNVLGFRFPARLHQSHGKLLAQVNPMGNHGKSWEYDDKHGMSWDES